MDCVRRLRGRFRPAPGNHEYEDPGANGYFTYFGQARGPGRQGFDAFRAATWHVLMLNSNVAMTPGSPQFEWARRELQNNRTRCALAVWHHRYASSGPTARTAVRAKNEWGVELVASGHDHLYERFAPQNDSYQHDAARGIRQFVVGTGGAPLYRAGARAPNTEAIAEAHGALQLTLNPATYDIEASAVRSLDVGSDLGH